MSNTRSSNSQDLTSKAFSFDGSGNLIINKQDLAPDILAKLDAANAAAKEPAIAGHGVASPQIITVSVSAIV